jgi:hypothetical protein
MTWFSRHVTGGEPRPYLWPCRRLSRSNAGRCSDVKGSLACPVFASISGAVLG